MGSGDLFRPVFRALKLPGIPRPPAADPPFQLQGDWAIDTNPWSTINNNLIEFAQMQKLEKGRIVFADTTVVETNIQTKNQFLISHIRIYQVSTASIKLGPCSAKARMSASASSPSV